MPISRMQNPRQLYGLGSIVKSIGKGVKSIIKSPIGKAAILGFGANALMNGGGLGSIFGKFGVQNLGLPGGADMGSKGSGLLGLFSKAKNFIGNNKLLSAGAAIGLGGAFGGMEDEQVNDLKRNPEALKQYLRQYYSNLNKNATQEEVDNFVNTNTSEYAMGGRVKYADGSDPIILPKAKPRESDGKRTLDILARNMKASQNTLGSKTLFNLMGKNAAKAYKAGDISKSQYDSMMKPFFGEPSERLSKKISEERKELRANGGRIGFNQGTLDPKIREIVIDLMDNEGFEFGKAVEEAYKRVEKTKPGKANGGRIGFNLGGDTKYNSMVTKMYIEAGGQEGTGMDIVSFADQYFPKKANGGRIGYAYGSDEIVDQASGIMGLPQRTNSEGIKELDLRDSGGFIPPVGVKEKADDVPAMLSNNEFVMTADAVRGMGGGNVNKGAQRLYDQMKMLEKGGRV